MYELKWAYFSVLVAALVVAGTLVTQDALAQQQGWGPPQQQQQGGHKWNGQFLKITNTLKTPAEPIEVHLKYRAQPCENCDFTWIPSAPDKPGDVSGRIEPGKSIILTDESGKPLVISCFVYWRKGLTSGRTSTEHKTQEGAVWCVGKDGYITAPNNERPTLDWEFRD